MTKRQLKQIMSLYKGGISKVSAVRIAARLSANRVIDDITVDRITSAVLQTIYEIDKYEEAKDDNS